VEKFEIDFETIFEKKLIYIKNNLHLPSSPRRYGAENLVECVF
jgi:hypothetical protein